MNTQELIEKLKILKQKTNEEWMSNLEDRKVKELEFHNKDRDNSLQKSLSKDTYDKIYGNRKFYKTIELSVSYKEEWFNPKKFDFMVSSMGRQTTGWENNHSQYSFPID